MENHHFAPPNIMIEARGHHGVNHQGKTAEKQELHICEFQESTGFLPEKCDLNLIIRNQSVLCKVFKDMKKTGRAGGPL